MSRPKSSEPIRWEMYLRPATPSRSKAVRYVRAIDTKSGKVILTKSAESDSKTVARALIAKLSKEVDFTRLAAAKTGSVADTTASGMRAMSLSAFFVQFWDKDESFYLTARTDSGKPLSSTYIASQYANVKNHAESFEGFKKTALQDAGLFLIESYVKQLRKDGISGNVIGDCLNAIRTPLSWAMNRNLVAEKFSFKGIDRPKETHKERGVLSRDEVAAIIALDVVDTVTPRPRLRKGKKHTTPGAVDLRVKVGVLLAHLAAMRAGEIRGLKWASIDFENKRIQIERNYVEGDGEKAPKRDSSGGVPLAEPLLEPLKALRALAFKLGKYNVNEYVLFGINTKPKKDEQAHKPAHGKPISIKALEAGYARTLEWIGIENDSKAKKEGRPPHPGSQQARHLTLHGGRHFAASLLADEIGPALARKITRHRSVAAFKGYADHESIEAMDAAREALRFEVKIEKKNG
ncbi:MAG: hypothetical protein CVV27_17140 [Candidatus Melainabacteria bacterium HGW-Melainabacteria-1]|nr:MAG: hypothetical protein CVV27_17140 [Candidatus Melainabacteria bacterium HGW-Melainabacteria-1]